MSSNEFRIGITLGEGSFGSVVLLTSRHDPSVKFAMKRQRKQTGQRNRQMRMEFLIHQRLSEVGHVNVIKLHSHSADDYYHKFVLDYVDGGELFHQLKEDVGIEKARAQNYFQQIASGLENIHGHGFVHRDIKPENILLTNTNVIKICDFGMAAIWRHKEHEAILTDYCGTKSYSAPELLSKVPHKGPPLDIWSTGIVLFVMLHGVFPWASSSKDDESYQRWLNGNLHEAPWPTMESSLLDLFRKFFTNDPSVRITMEQIKGHSWFNKEFVQEVPQKKSLKRSRFTDESDSAASKRVGSLYTLDAKKPCLEPFRKRPQSCSTISSDVSSASEADK